MKNDKNSKSTFLIMLLISGIFFVFLLLDYNKTQQDAFDEIAENTLYETVSQQQFGIKSLINAEFGLLQTLGNTSYLVESDEDLLMLLQNLTLTTNYYRLFWIDTEKQGLSNEGSVISFERSEIVDRALEGGTFVSDPLYSEADNELYIVTATPSYNRDGSINGAVCGIYTPKSLNSLLLSSFTDKGVAHIVNTKGQYIASTYQGYEYSTDVNGSIASIFKDATFEGESLESAVNDISSLQGGEISYSIGDEQFKAAYKPLEISDWSVIVTVPLNDLIPSSISLQNRTYSLYIFFAVVFFISLIVFIQHEGRSKRRLFQTAYYDVLTGLPNSEKFKLDAEHLMKTYPNDRFSCIVFDVAKFKLINDSFGNQFGDIVLKEVATIATSYMKARKGEVIVGRLHSDVFLMFSKENDIKDANSIKASLIEQSRRNPSTFRNIKLDFYLGRYICNPSDDIDMILERAKIAHSHAKNSNVNEFIDYNSAIVEELHLMNSILTEFEQALANHEFKLFVQPQFDAKTEKISGAEVLVRWIENGTVKYMPNEFISILEKSNDILLLDAYIREQAFILLRKWEDEGLSIPSLSVNVSRLDLLRPDFAYDLVLLAQQYKISPSKLHLEITETTYVKDPMQMIKVVTRLRQQGFCIEMDDFGSGYSSLNILKDLSLDTIKLDMKFLNDHTKNKNGEIIIASIISMAQNLNLNVIAEGTETMHQVNYLRDIGCNELQGYYFARPMPVEEFEQTMLKKKL